MPQYKLDPEIKQPAYLQLYHQLRDDITGGICPYGTRLPSKRFLAAETGTSVITVQHAYDLLADEGYIESRERSGFFVSYREHELFPAANTAANAAAGRIGTLEMPEIHEISDIPLRGPVVSPEEEQFPFSVLARTARRVLSERGESLLQRSPNSGTIELREAIAQYLARSRRINVLPEQIVIFDVLSVMEGTLVPVACLEKNAKTCARMSECQTLPLWKGLNEVVTDYLNRYTIRDLMRREDDSYDYVI